MYYPDNIEQKIDMCHLRNQLRQLALSPMGREQVDAIQMQIDYDVIVYLHAELSEMRCVLEDASLGFPEGQMHDIREAVNRIRIEGLYLDEQELFHLSSTLDYALQLERFYYALDAARFPILTSHRWLPTINNQSDYVAVLQHIDRILDRYGRLADTASPELGRIRRDLQAAENSVERILMGILHRAQNEGLLDRDTTPTLREGRLVLPVPPAIKRKIGGIVHDESATGKTIYMEPQQVVEANNRIRELQSDEQRERIRILQSISDEIRPILPTILEREEWLGHIDMLRAKVLLAQQLNAISPQLVNRPYMDWRDARHAVLYINFTKQGKQVVPMTIRLGDKHRILVISGPNAGGKSVCLKTVALTQYMMQCGLMVPMREDSQMGIFEQILLDIGDEQSIEDDLSTYSSHLRNMKTFVQTVGPKSLFLIDEFGTGTEPLLGGAIAEAVLKYLTKSGALGIVTTHYTNLKHLAERTLGMVNGSMLYDRAQLCPLFQLSIGQAGSSFAIEIARKIGLPQTIIQDATSLVGAEHIDYDRQLQDIARDKRYWQEKRQAIRQQEKTLAERVAYYEQELANIKDKRKVILQKAEAEAAEILRQSNATIERTIREIRESKADKERTRQARQRVENQKARVQTIVPNHSEITDRKKKCVLHDFSELKPMSKCLPSQPKTVANTIRQHTLSFNRNLDLRGYRADEALEMFIAYLDDAIMVNAGEVTILHGTGTGALKQVVRDYLAQMNKQRVKRHEPPITYHDGDPDRGGAGLTIVEI